MNRTEAEDFVTALASCAFLRGLASAGLAPNAPVSQREQKLRDKIINALCRHTHYHRERT